MIVNTKYGRVRGVQEGSIFVFRGIPYAAPPTGNRRFMPPQPPEPWEGIREAVEFGFIASQRTAPNPMNDRIPSEDCLTLNVWTPGHKQEPCPVLFHIHGGGLVGGSGSDCDGSKFAKDNHIVYVSLNYRVGALGFLYLGDLLGEAYRTSGNNGIQDIIAALKWVQDHIAGFCGDPNRVTIKGNSAGAKCVSTLLTVPAAAGMFHGAIAQSGATQTVRDPHTASQITLHLLEKLGLRENEAYKLLDLPAEVIVRNQEQLLHTFGPVVDGIILTAAPLEVIRQGASHHVPLLIGTNKDEAVGFTAADPVYREPTDDIIHSLFGSNGSFVRETYRAACSLLPPAEAWNRTLTDCLYRIATVRLAEACADQHIPVWLYRFDFAAGSQGAVHSAEEAFVNDNAENYKSPVDHLFVLPSEGRQLAHRIHAVWVAFVHHGTPQTADLPEWPVFSTEQRALMALNSDCHIEHDLPLSAPGFSNQVLIL